MDGARGLATDVLGFHYWMIWGKPGSFTLVVPSGMMIMLRRLCRDFEVEDCNGYRLCFGKDLDADSMSESGEIA